jgi:hypothetical protein
VPSVIDMLTSVVTPLFMSRTDVRRRCRRSDQTSAVLEKATQRRCAIAGARDGPSPPAVLRGD